MRRNNSGVNGGDPAHQRYDKHGEEYRNFIAWLRTNTATATMAAVALNIYRPSTCRFKRWAEKSGILWEVRKDICAVTGFPAMYLTTDPQKAPNVKEV